MTLCTLNSDATQTMKLRFGSAINPECKSNNAYLLPGNTSISSVVLLGS